MDNKQIQYLLRELVFRKDQALAQTVTTFPAKFYAFAEMVVTTPVIIEIVKKVRGTQQDDCVDYDEVIKSIDQLAKVMYKSLVEYLSNVENNSSFMAQLQSFPIDQAMNFTIALLQITTISRTIMALRNDPTQRHHDFFEKNAKEISQIGELQNILIAENSHAYLISKVREWGALHRIFRICQTYNQKWYKARHAELMQAGRLYDAFCLEVNYNELQRCIGRSSSEDDYDRCFNVAEDKLAIQDIYDHIERELLKLIDHNGESGQEDINRKINIVELNKAYIKVVVGNNSKKVKRNSDRGKTISFFSRKDKCDEKKLHSIVTGVKSTDSLDSKQFKKNENVIKNVNEFFNDNFSIAAAINTKSIASHSGNTAEYSRNSLYW